MSTAAKEITPQDLIDRIADEAITLLALAGRTAIPDTDLSNESIRLIGKAWKLPCEGVENALALVATARASVAKDENHPPHTDTNTISDLPSRAALISILGLLVGTTLLLDSNQERNTIHAMTDNLATCFGFSELMEDGWASDDAG